MSEVTYTQQIRYSGNGPLDAKLSPYRVYEDILMMPRSQRYVGMVVTVTNDSHSGGQQADYWLVGGTANINWKKKEYGAEIKVSGDDIE